MAILPEPAGPDPVSQVKTKNYVVPDALVRNGGAQHCNAIDKCSLSTGCPGGVENLSKITYIFAADGLETISVAELLGNTHGA